jgi:DNA-binding response OmpR family regulator
MAKILVVEDDVSVNKVVCDYLRFDHHVVESVIDGTEALARLTAYSYDLLIIDWDIPRLNGLDLCKQYRANGGSAPILMMTGKSEIGEKTEGLDAGCDDYLTKPFDTKELSARVRALLRRASGQLTKNVLQIGDIRLEPNTYRATKNNEELRLVPKEFAILEFLMRHPDMVFSCEALMSRIWTADEEASPEIIRTHIKNLRKKLQDDGKLISTVHGVGYKLSAR